MSSTSSQAANLKEACSISGADWCAVIHQEADLWLLAIGEHLNVNHQAALIEYIKTAEFNNWIGPTPIARRVKSRKLGPHENLQCNRIYGFPISGMKIILVGTAEKMEADNQRFWKLVAALIEPTIIPIRPDEEVDLLQNTVMELQLTQQELQARIAAQREAEARLIQAAKLAAVGEMAAGVAHELNNPLTSVVGFTELALEELTESSELKSDLELVLKEARRARSVVRRLLDFARQSETVRVKAEINEIIEDVLVLTRHFIQINNVKLTVRLTENLRWAWVDRNQIKQVVINLVNNAVYAMPNGGTIFIETVEQQRYGQDWVTLTVRDTGVGISQENMNRIFEPFFTTRGEHGGTGLGLSVTYGIVTDHGGMIEFESQVNVGSTFVVWLPLDAPS